MKKSEVVDAHLDICSLLGSVRSDLCALEAELKVIEAKLMGVSTLITHSDKNPLNKAYNYITRRSLNA